MAGEGGEQQRRRTATDAVATRPKTESGGDGGSSSTAIRVVKTIVTTPKYASISGLWLLGLFFMLLMRAPYTPSEADEIAYKKGMIQADNLPGLVEAEVEMAEARARVYNEQVWFWRWRPEYRVRVEAAQQQLNRVTHNLRNIYAERDALRKEAKSKVGIWSEYGFQETRDLFWSCWKSGKEFAQRMTFWDVIFGIGGGRDESFMVTILRFVLRLIMNFTIGLCGALVGFAWYLGRLWKVIMAMLGPLGRFFSLHYWVVSQSLPPLLEAWWVWLVEVCT